MRITILLVCCALFAMLGRTGSSSSMQTPRSSHQTTTNANAAVLWEQAIAAKGGRERLYGVQNLVEFYPDKRSLGVYMVGLYVFPKRFWRWTDDRPTPLGVYVEMINLERDLAYLAEEDSGLPVNRGKYGAKARGEGPLLDAQLNYLLETQWVKPVPVRVYSGNIGSKSVDIIQTIVNGYRFDFHLDKQSHLPLEVAFPWPQNSEGTNYGRGTIYATFSDYADVNGIQMPRKVGHLARPEMSISVQVNVEYDPAIFEHPPNIKAGPDAWRPGNSRISSVDRGEFSPLRP